MPLLSRPPISSDIGGLAIIDIFNIIFHLQISSIKYIISSVNVCLTMTYNEIGSALFILPTSQNTPLLWDVRN